MNKGKREITTRVLRIQKRASMGQGPELQCHLKVKEDLIKLSIDISTCYSKC